MAATRGDYVWDFFIAHAGPDRDAAHELWKELSSTCRVFLDAESLEYGDDWDLALPEAQRNSRVTVVLVSGRTEKAYYLREEIAAAIAMTREDKDRHRVVPVYLDIPPFDDHDVPYGLRPKHGLSISRDGGLKGAALKLAELFARLNNEPVQPMEVPDAPAVRQYKADLQAALDRYYPQPSPAFDLSVAFHDGRTAPVSALADETLRARRFALKAPAGSGKTMVSGSFARILQGKGYLPVVLNLKNWQKEKHCVLSASLRSGTGSEAVALRHPVMPIANGLGCGFVGIDGSQLR